METNASRHKGISLEEPHLGFQLSSGTGLILKVVPRIQSHRACKSSPVRTPVKSMNRVRILWDGGHARRNRSQSARGRYWIGFFSTFCDTNRAGDLVIQFCFIAKLKRLLMMRMYVAFDAEERESGNETTQLPTSWVDTFFNALPPPTKAQKWSRTFR